MCERPNATLIFEVELLAVKEGSAEGDMRFVPDKLEFETGRLYKLVLHNPSATAHYFSSPALAHAVFTRKAQVFGPDGKRIAEIKGNVSEIQVEPGGTAEWWFVPVKTLALADVRCPSKGHTEANLPPVQLTPGLASRSYVAGGT